MTMPNNSKDAKYYSFMFLEILIKTEKKYHYNAEERKELHPSV